MLFKKYQEYHKRRVKHFFYLIRRNGLKLSLFEKEVLAVF